MRTQSAVGALRLLVFYLAIAVPAAGSHRGFPQYGASIERAYTDEYA